MSKFLLPLLSLLLSITVMAETYVPEEGSAELIKNRKKKVPYDPKLPNVLICSYKAFYVALNSSEGLKIWIWEMAG